MPSTNSWSTQAMNKQFVEHCNAVNTTSGQVQQKHMNAARGLYKVLKARFDAGDYEALPIGAAQHWMIRQG